MLKRTLVVVSGLLAALVGLTASPAAAQTCPAGSVDDSGYCWVFPTSAQIGHQEACDAIGLEPTPTDVPLVWDAARLSAVTTLFGYTSIGDFSEAASAMWCNPTTMQCGTHNFSPTTFDNYGPYGDPNWWPVYTCKKPGMAAPAMSWISMASVAAGLGLIATRRLRRTVR